MHCRYSDCLGQEISSKFARHCISQVENYNRESNFGAYFIGYIKKKAHFG